MRAWAARRAAIKLLHVHSADADADDVEEEAEEADDADEVELDGDDDDAADDAPDLPLNVNDALLFVREWLPNDAEKTDDSE